MNVILSVYLLHDGVNLIAYAFWLDGKPLIPYNIFILHREAELKNPLPPKTALLSIESTLKLFGPTLCTRPEFLRQSLTRIPTRSFSAFVQQRFAGFAFARSLRTFVTSKLF